MNPESKTCSICYDNLVVSNTIVTPCNHYFCSQCFFTWLRTQNTCPMCRLDFLNREINRHIIKNISRDSMKILLKTEEVAEYALGIITENKELNKEKNNKLNEIQNLKYEELKILKTMEKNKKIIKISSSTIKTINQEITFLKIKKINLMRKKLKLSGKLNF